jgi:hypothetical protein
MPKMLDITGQKYGRLTALQINHRIKNLTFWEFICDCGNSHVANIANVRFGHTTSCGCVSREAITKHGMHKTSEYHAWNRMKQRCLNPQEPHYHNYGGRGITLCKRWEESFDNFIADVGRKPTPRHSIDRIDNNGNYEPSNVKWSTQTQQCRNKRISKYNKTGCSGVWFNKRIGKFESSINVFQKKLILGYFASLEDAVAARKAAELKYWNT